MANPEGMLEASTLPVCCADIVDLAHAALKTPCPTDGAEKCVLCDPGFELSVHPPPCSFGVL